MIRDHRAARGIAVAGALAMLMAGCGQQPTDPGNTAGGSPEHLWDRSFASIELTVNGERVTFEGEPFSVGFEDRADGPVVRWSGGCNLVGSPAEVTGQKIRIEGPVDSTTIGCTPELEKGDQWMSEFFAGDPTWALGGDDRLTLEAGNRRAVFKKVARFPAEG